MIDQVTGPWTHKKAACPIGRAEGRAECQATHGFLTDKARNEGYDAGRESTHGYVNDARARGEARGRLQGVLIVAGLVGLAWILRAR